MVGLKVLIVGGSGYVGTFLYSWLVNEGFDVDICDRGDRGHPADIPVRFAFDASYLRDADIREYDHILWFAGVSSVRDAVERPLRAIEDNVLTLSKLAALKREDAHLTYASSASLYSNVASNGVVAALENDAVGSFSNPYDLSKYLFDLAAETLFAGTTALRMGTVCGFSPQLRRELIFNAMCLSAMENGYIGVANPGSFRSILFLDHLRKVVLGLLTNNDLRSVRIMNVGSLSFSIGELAEQISAVLGSQIKRFPDGFTYSFTMNFGLLDSYGLGFEGSLESQAQQFVQEAR